MKKHNRKRNSESGMATIEMIPMILLFILLICYTFGAFGIIHTGIMQSISARSYAFETFRNRANVTYFRDTPGHEIFQFRKVGDRVHAVTSEVKEGANVDFPAAQRMIAMGRSTTLSNNIESFHNVDGASTTIYSILPGNQNTKVAVNPAWIMVQYGICLNAGCGQ